MDHASGHETSEHLDTHSLKYLMWPTEGEGGTPEAPPHSALHRSHLALQVDSLGPANIVCIDDLHDVGAAKALFLHLLGSPDAGELDEGAFLGQPEKRRLRGPGKAGLFYFLL